ncbi:D-inositol-3-phosphate glycosyltransferase [Candidatus Magnetaquicoccaceae bacterium FCR-1]|uniref:D-inositol-3-phosphate glycosyltransferase n=1 Tax=Candidatus Magnetaquiglobus chichijimensis TaxID=3141448 RepID=A0ABQ0C9F5_9PROT
MNGPSGARHVLVVFHATFPVAHGGINVMIAELAHAWSAMGIRVSLFAPGPWGQKTLSVERFGPITLYKMRLRPLWDRRRPLRGLLGLVAELPRTLWTLWRLIRREGVDVIHFHTARDYQFFFHLLRWFGGPPGVTTFHGTDALVLAEGKRRDTPLLRWIVRRSAAVTAVAPHIGRLIERACPDLAPVRVVLNGVNVGIGGALDQPPDDMRLPERFWVVVGWVEPPKGQDVAIRAWAEVSRLWPDLHLVIVGGQTFFPNGEPHFPGFFEAMLNLVAENGTAERVHFLGQLPREQVLAVMARARGLLFPSLREGLPYALLEAGLFGLPVVCHRIPPFSDLIGEGVNGLLIPVGDDRSLAEAVSRLESDPEAARRMGEAWREQVHERHSVRAMARGYVSLFATLAGDETGWGVRGTSDGS